MTKKYFFGGWHSSRKACNEAYRKLRLDVSTSRFKNNDNKGLNGEVYVFVGDEKYWFNYIYKNYLTDNKIYLQQKNLDIMPKEWGIRNLCPGNYPLCYVPHNSVDDKFIDIKKKLVFNCFHNVKQEIRTEFRLNLNTIAPRNSLDEICYSCGLPGTEENPLQLDHVNPTFYEICDMFEEKFGPLVPIATYMYENGLNSFNKFNEFHDSIVNYQFLHRKKCHPAKTAEDRKKIKRKKVA